MQPVLDAPVRTRGAPEYVSAFGSASRKWRMKRMTSPLTVGWLSLSGRNECRYVPPARREACERAVAGYARFMKLAERYADAVIARTEREIAKIKVVDGRTLRFAKTRQK